MVRENQELKRYAVVTGASRGLGRAFATELSRKGINTILISSNPAISALCKELAETYKTDSQYIIADLIKEEDLLSAADKINASYNIYILVNNAGIGGTQAFDQVEVSYIEKMLHLNVVATSLLCRQLLSNLLRNPRSHILNVSSLAALTPVGYKMAYPASKAFIRHFSRGLRAEFKERGLMVSVVSPGAMATSDDICKRIARQGFLGRLTLVKPEDVARKCIRQMLRGRKEILVNPVGYIFSLIVPGCIKTPILTHIVRREIEEKR